MPAMTEAEVYQYLTKDGDSLPAVKKNTEMLRQHFTIESQRVAHTLSQLDPHNKDRHEAEAQRVYQENNAVLDRVLMQIASTTPQKMPLPIEMINKASVATGIPKNKAKAVLSLPLILFAAIPGALLAAIAIAFVIGAVVLVAAIVNALIFKIDASGLKASFTGLDGWLIAKVYYGLCYVGMVIYGFSKVRGGETVGNVFNELFLEPLIGMIESLGK